MRMLERQESALLRRKNDVAKYRVMLTKVSSEDKERKAVLERKLHIAEADVKSLETKLGK